MWSSHVNKLQESSREGNDNLFTVVESLFADKHCQREALELNKACSNTQYENIGV